MKTTLIAIATITARPGKLMAVQAALQEAVVPSRTEAGCISYALHVDNKHPDRFMTVEEWDSDEALAQHMTMPHIKQLMQKIGDLSEVKITQLNQIA